MALSLSGTLTLTTDPSRDDYLPRIGYENHYRTGTVAASTEATNYPADLAYDGFTDTAWIGSDAVTEWSISVNKAGATAEYCGILLYGDNPLSAPSGITITLQSSDDGGSTWNNVADPVLPSDRVVVFLFDAESHDDWRVHFSGTTPPQVADVSLGEVMIMPVGLRSGFEPPKQARNRKITNNNTDVGHLAGRSIIRKGIETQLQFNAVSESFVRNEWEPFIDHAELRPWYIVWSPINWPNEAALVWTDRDIQPPRYRNNYGHMDLRLRVKGFAE